MVGDLYQEQENTQANAEAAREIYENGELSQADLEEFERRALEAKANLPDKAIAHALVGGLTALLGGGDFIKGATAAGMSEKAAEELKEELPNNPLLKNMVATLVGTSLSGELEGGIIAANADKFNRQLHPAEMDFLEDEERLKRYQQEVANHDGREISLKEAEDELKITALFLVSESWEEELDKKPSDFSKHFLLKESSGKRYLKSDGSGHALLAATQAERKDDFINLEFYSDIRDRLKGVLPEATLFDYMEWAGVPVAAPHAVFNEVVDTVKGLSETAQVVADPETHAKLKRFTAFAKENPEQAKTLLFESARKLGGEVEKQLLREMNKYALYEDQNRNYDTQVAGAQDGLSTVNPLKKISVGGTLAVGIVKNIPDDKLTKGPYNPNKTRADLEAKHGKDSVTSTTGPHGTTVKQEITSTNNLGDPNAGEVNTDRIRPVNGRSPYNSQKYAGTTIPLENLPPEIAKKYPKSVHFSGAGYPDFTPYAIKKTKIELTGSRSKDFKLANQAVGLKKTPKGYTWHHHQEFGIMQLVPRDLHDAVKHTGGVATSGIKPYK